jgi:SAM-dependent methyltransferase
VTPDDLITWAAPERNKAPILEVLARVLGTGLVLEVASGTGQHALHFAKNLPHIDWQPSERDPELIEVIHARHKLAKLPNLRRPVVLDVTQPSWPIGEAHAVYSANLIHIAPWRVSEALVRGTARVLKTDGVLVTYGPYKVAGSHTAPSNAAFDASLKARDPQWGVRDLHDVDAEAWPARRSRRM